MPDQLPRQPLSGKIIQVPDAGTIALRFLGFVSYGHGGQRLGRRRGALKE